MERIDDIEKHRPEIKRRLQVIAQQIQNDWSYRIHYAAKPYLEAMLKLDTLDDMFGADSAESIVRYFLGNAQTWRGPVARAIKKELNDMLKKRD